MLRHTKVKGRLVLFKTELFTCVQNSRFGNNHTSPENQHHQAISVITVIQPLQDY